MLKYHKKIEHQQKPVRHYTYNTTSLYYILKPDIVELKNKPNKTLNNFSLCVMRYFPIAFVFRLKTSFLFLFYCFFLFYFIFNYCTVVNFLLLAICVVGFSFSIFVLNRPVKC